MSGTWIMIKTGLIKQIRSYKFLVVLVIAIGFAYFCVPTSGDNYNIFIIGGTRGVYNSAYLGIIASAISSVILFLAGFYLLRNQITEDRELKVGQIIAAKAISKQRYVFSKAISNFLILLLLETVFLIAIMVVQIIRGEELNIAFMGYVRPFLEITMPYLFVLTSLTVLFDTIPFLRGMFGNIIFFALWNAIIINSVTMHKPILDLLGIDRIISSLTQGAINAYQGINSDKFINDVNFGLNYGTKGLSTFVWNGLEADRPFLITRIIWICIALALILFSSLVFDRFRRNKTEHSPSPKNSHPAEKSTDKKTVTDLSLSPVARTQHRNLLLLIKGELTIMRSELSFGQIGLLIIGIALQLFLPRNDLFKWLSLFLVLPVSIWARMGCRDKQYRTQEFISSRCDMRDKWIAAGIAGLIIALVISSGAILRFTLTGEWLQAVSWFVGMYFIVSLAITLGTLTGSRRLFEALFIMWLYLGPIQEVAVLNFLSNSVGTIVLYELMGIFLTAIGFFTVSLKEKRITK